MTHLPKGDPRQVRQEPSIPIWGDGTQTRSFMYIDDCTKGTLAIRDSSILEPINLGSTELVKINGLVDIVEEIAGTAGFTTNTCENTATDPRGGVA